MSTYVDALFDGLAREEQRIINILTSDSRELIGVLWGDYLKVDDACAVHVTPTRSLRSCNACRDFARLGLLNVGAPVAIECGRRVGTAIVINRRPMGHDVREDSNIKRETERLVTKDNRLLECGTCANHNSIYLCADPTTCEILVKIVMQNILPSCCNYLFTAFRCGGEVYLVEKHVTPLTTIEQSLLTPSFATNVVTQIITILSALAPYSYAHGTPSPQHITIDGDYVGLDVGSHSALTLGHTRLCSTVNPPWKPVGTSLIPTLDKRWVTSANIVLYCINQGEWEAFNARRMSGIPLYPGSFDLYCILVGLCCHPAFTAIINKMWLPLWVGNGDLRTITNRIDQWRVDNKDNNYPPYHNILTMLSGLWLRCDAVALLSNGLYPCT